MTADLLIHYFFPCDERKAAQVLNTMELLVEMAYGFACRRESPRRSADAS